MQKSDSIKEISAALVKVQGSLKPAIKDSKNPFFKSSYADLASCYAACRKELSDNGIAVVQPTKDSGNGKIVVETMLVHTSGEWIMGELSLKPVKDDPQAVGSAITYARRYGLCAMVGIAPEDDDGNAASGNSSNGTHETLPKKQLVQSESEIHSPKTSEARAKAADPLQNKYLNGKWRSVVNFYAKKDSPIKGKTLGQIEALSDGLATLHRLASTFKPSPNPKTGVISGESYDLRDALTAFETERQLEKESGIQEDAEPVNDLATDDIPF